MSTLRHLTRASSLGLVVAGFAGAPACSSSDDGSGARGDHPDAGSGGLAEGTGGIGSGGAASGGGVSPAASGGSASGGTTSAGGNAPGGGANEPGSVDCRAEGDGTTTLTFVNRCPDAVTYRGSDIPGGELPPGAFACVAIGTDVETLSAKRYWGFSGNDPGGGRHTLAEFTFNTDFNDFDWYNISHVDAFNLPIQILPVGRPDCRTLRCGDLLTGCPAEGRFESGGELVSCVSPDRDDPQASVPLHFESCDDAYAWSGDDQNGDDPSPMRACAGEDWDITFCPTDAP